jgi:glycosyltransferase involved in cell wall biosynthesis
MEDEMVNEKSICMPVYSYYPFDLRVRRAAEALLEKGHKVDIICLRDADESKFGMFNGVNIYRVSLIHRRGGYLRYIYHYTLFFLQIFVLLNILDLRKKYDVIHVHSLPDFLVFGAIVQKLKGKKIILDLHEVMPEIFAARFNKDMNSFRVKIMCVLERLSTTFADRVITVNDVRKEVILNRGVPSGKIVVIMNAPDEKLLVKRDLKDFKAKFRLKDKFITVYIGGINYERNLEVVLRALSIVKKDIPNIFFIIFGHTYGLAGEKYKDDLKALADDIGLSENVYFGGQLPGEDIASYMELAHFGIVSYVKNPMTELAMPNKVFENIAANNPIISCRLKGIYTLLGEEAAIYYEPENEHDLAEKIKWIHFNRDETKKLVKNARIVYKKFSWNVMKRRLQELYETI